MITCGAVILINPPLPVIAALSVGAGATVALAVMLAELVAVTLELAASVMVPPEVFGVATAVAACAEACAGVCAVKVKLAIGADGVFPLAGDATLITVVVPLLAACAAWAILVLRVAVVGAIKLMTLTAGVIVVVPLFDVLTITAAADTLAALVATLLLATVAATAVAD